MRCISPKNLSNPYHAFFALALTVSEILTFEIIDLEKIGHGVKLLHWRHSIANIKIFKHQFFHIFYFREDTTCVHESNLTHIHTDTNG